MMDLAAMRLAGSVCMVRVSSRKPIKVVKVINREFWPDQNCLWVSLMGARQYHLKYTAATRNFASIEDSFTKCNSMKGSVFLGVACEHAKPVV